MFTNFTLVDIFNWPIILLYLVSLGVHQTKSKQQTFKIKPVRGETFAVSKRLVNLNESNHL